MTILWCGGEDIDFVNADISTFGNGYDSEFARVALDRSSSISGYSVSSFGPITSGWVSFRVRNGGGFYGTGARMVGLTKKTSLDKGIFVGVASYLKVGLMQYDGTTCTTLESESGQSIVSNEINRYDMQIINYGSSAQVKVYIEGVLVIDYSGNIAIIGVDSFDSVAVFLDTTSGVGASEIIVADEDTRLMRLKTLVPNAAGDTSANWTGEYTDIDEITISDADKIYANTADADFQCGITGMPNGLWGVKALKVAARCVEGGGTKGVAIGVKTNSTVNVGDTETCSGYWQTKERLMTVNPVTGNPWTPAEIEALQLNLRCMAV